MSLSTKRVSASLNTSVAGGTLKHISARAAPTSAAANINEAQANFFMLSYPISWLYLAHGPQLSRIDCNTEGEGLGLQHVSATSIFVLEVIISCSPKEHAKRELDLTMTYST